MAYKIADAPAVVVAALQVLRTHRGVVPTQRELWERVGRRLAREEPPLRCGPERMRAILALSDGIRLETRYAARSTHRPLSHCPVCFHELKPRQNETLWGDLVIVGYTCTACHFWTPLKRRVPAQYTFRAEPSGL